MRGTRGATRSRGQRLLYPPPSLDLRFAETKSLTDWISGQNLVTFTRASSGTYVGSDGVLKTAVTNLLLRSEEFDNASWTLNGILAFGSGSTANATTAPNGTTTADLLTENTSTGLHRITQVISYTSGTTYTFSVYVKATGRTKVRLLGSNPAVWPGDVYFDISSGTIITAIGGTGSISSVGDGWFRCAVTATATATAATGTGVSILDAGNNSSYTGDGTSGIYIWGAQLEQSSTVGEYIPTTSTINSAPRFDHNPTTGESLGLLVEEQRTNLLLRSEEFDNSYWSKIRGNVTPNAAIAPNNTQTADLYTADGTFLYHTIGAFGVISGIATRSYSVYAKADTASIIQLNVIATADAFVNFDLANGTYGTVSIGPNVTNPSIQSVGNGWYRCSFTATSNADGFEFGPTAALTDTRRQSNSISGSVYFWGAQLEAGAFPTSYIPTTTATATRSADVASITGANFSSWYRQDEGTIFVDFVRTFSGSFPNFPNIYNISDGTGNNRILMFGNQSAQTFTVGITSAGAPQLAFVSFASTVSGPNKAVHSFAQNSSVLCSNGVLTTPDTSVLMPTVDRMDIGIGLGQQFTGIIRRLVYWPQRLPNNSLVAITR